MLLWDDSPASAWFCSRKCSFDGGFERCKVFAMRLEGSLDYLLETNRLQYVFCQLDLASCFDSLFHAP